MSPQIKGGESTDLGCLGLGPADYGDGKFGDAFMEFEFDVDTAGTYVITVRYAAKQAEGQIRCADMIVNGGERIPLPIENTGDWAIYMDAVVEVELNAGTNIIHLKNVENFDNSTYKAINVDFLAWEILGGDTSVETEAEPETEAPATEAPETEAPATEAETESEPTPETTAAPETTAPEKSGCGSALGTAAITLISILGIAVISRKN